MRADTYTGLPPTELLLLYYLCYNEYSLMVNRRDTKHDDLPVQWTPDKGAQMNPRSDESGTNSRISATFYWGENKYFHK